MSKKEPKIIATDWDYIIDQLINLANEIHEIIHTLNNKKKPEGKENEEDYDWTINSI